MHQSGNTNITQGDRDQEDTTTNVSQTKGIKNKQFNEYKI